MSEKIIASVNKSLIGLGLLKEADISGIWKATFEFGDGQDKEEYTEIIKLKHRFGVVFGNIVPHDDNYNTLREHEHKKPLRIRGSIADNTLFTGFWFHPIKTYRFHGTFQLLISGKLDNMEGQWIGCDESRGQIDCGKWRWTKIS